MKMRTWRELITRALIKRGETWDDVISCTLDDSGLDLPFNVNLPYEDGATFTVWTNYSVYFPASYDGLEWVAAVSRNPDGKPTEHNGDGSSERADFEDDLLTDPDPAIRALIKEPDRA